MTSNDKFRLKTQADVARFFDVEPSTVSRWIAKGMPGKAGHFDIGQITRWLFTLGPWRREDFVQGVLQRAVYGETKP